MKYYYGPQRTMIDLKKTVAIVAFRVDGRKSMTTPFFNKEGWRPAVFSNMAKAAGQVEPDATLQVSRIYIFFIALLIYSIKFNVIG